MSQDDNMDFVGPFTSPLPNMGEADTIREIDHVPDYVTVVLQQCGVRSERGKICTRRWGHPGEHLAGDGRKIVDRWSRPGLHPMQGIDRVPAASGQKHGMPPPELARQWAAPGLTSQREVTEGLGSQRETLKVQFDAEADPAARVRTVIAREILECRRFQLAAELYAHSAVEAREPLDQGEPHRRPYSAEEALRHADDLILEHLGTLDKFLERVREAQKEGSDA